MRFEAEVACDDLVLAGGAKASEYAALLVETANGLRRLDPMRLAAAAMGDSVLEGRVRAILDGKRNRRFPSPRLQWGFCAAMACLIVPLSLVKPTAAAQADSLEQISGTKAKLLATESLFRSGQPDQAGSHTNPRRISPSDRPAPLNRTGNLPTGPELPDGPLEPSDSPKVPTPIGPSPPLESVLAAQVQPDPGPHGSRDLLAQQPAPAPRPLGPGPHPAPLPPQRLPHGVRAGSAHGIPAGSSPKAETTASPETIRAAVTALAAALKSSDPEVRKQAAESLGRMGEAALPAVKDLSTAIEDAEPQVQKEALQALGRILQHTGAEESEQAVAAFERILQSDDPAMRKDAAEALGRMRGAAGRALEVLIPALSDPDPQVQKEVAEGIGRLMRHAESSELSQAVSSLSKALPGAPPEVRREIVESLGRLRNNADEVVLVLIEAVDDPDPQVQKEAVEALGRILGRGQRLSAYSQVGAEMEEIEAAVDKTQERLREFERQFR